MLNKGKKILHGGVTLYIYITLNQAPRENIFNLVSQKKQNSPFARFNSKNGYSLEQDKVKEWIVLEE